MTPGTVEFAGLFEQFRGAVPRHAQAEEAEVLPILRRTQTPGALQKMAKAFELAEKVAPSHAHPHAGTGALSNMVAGPALAIMDRVRDAIHTS